MKVDGRLEVSKIPLKIYRINTTNLPSYFDNAWIYANVFQKREINEILSYGNTSVYSSLAQLWCI